jgi:ketosteroid isomerase-like protein
MSQENVDTVREAVEAFNSGDMEAALARVHPDVEWTTGADAFAFPDAQTYRGPEGVRQFFMDWLDTFQGFQLHLDKCLAAGDELVIAALRVSGEGAASGAAVESPTFFQVMELRDGLVFRARMFPNESQALEAAGLSE